MFSNCKLIVSDMDGTLLNDQGEVSHHFFELFHQLQQKNILFCAASGRQYDSIISKLNPISNEIYVIAENGSNVKFKNKNLLQVGLATDLSISVIKRLRKIKDAYTVLCTNQGAYVETTNQQFINLFQEYYTNYHLVSDIMEVVDQVTVYKIASFNFTSSEDHIFPFIKDLGTSALLKVSGKHWLDISSFESNKGKALQLLQKNLGIKKEETIVIGDYLNDLELFDHAGVGFAVKNAHPKIKEIATFETADNNNFGVEKVIEKILGQLV